MKIPLFDKAIDDRLQQEEWRQVTGPLDLILFEGWCVGALPQQEEALIEVLVSDAVKTFEIENEYLKFLSKL